MTKLQNAPDNKQFIIVYNAQIYPTKLFVFFLSSDNGTIIKIQFEFLIRICSLPVRGS